MAVSLVAGCGRNTSDEFADQPPDLIQAFENGRIVTNDIGRFTLKLEQAGELAVSSGRIVACDAFVFHDQALSKKVAPGKYPVILSVACFTNDQRVACAMLRISEKRVAKWTFGYSYGVDSGTGSFMDRDAARLYEAKVTRDSRFFEHIIDAMEKSKFTNFVLDPASGANVIAFSSGFGDGQYSTYIGLDEEGQVARIVTDFGLLTE
jgi:hypothetical protein